MKYPIKRQVEDGSYQAIAALQAAITEGIASGEPQPFDAAAFKLRLRERHVTSSGSRQRPGRSTQSSTKTTDP
jgi:hypothetical protein